MNSIYSDRFTRLDCKLADYSFEKHLTSLFSKMFASEGPMQKTILNISAAMHSFPTKTHL